MKGGAQYIEIYSEIAKYYPIGIECTNPVYSEYSGIRLLNKLKFDKLEHPAYHKWQELIHSIAKSVGSVIEVNTETSLHSPSYCGVLLLEKTNLGIATYMRKVCISLSVLTNLYTICGLDEIVLSTGQRKGLTFPPIVYISPTEGFERWFPILRAKIETGYPSYRFLSFNRSRMVIEGLSIGRRGPYSGDASIYDAIFGNEYIKVDHVLGDIFYE